MFVSDCWERIPGNAQLGTGGTGRGSDEGAGTGKAGGGAGAGPSRAQLRKAWRAALTLGPVGNVPAADLAETTDFQRREPPRDARLAP